MKRITCEVCGGIDLVKQDGEFICRTCGCKYSIDEVRKLIQGVGLQKVISSNISIQDEQNHNMVQAARNAMSDGRFDSAYTLSMQALTLFPDNPEMVAIQSLSELGRADIMRGFPTSASNGMNRFFSMIHEYQQGYQARIEMLENVEHYIDIACRGQLGQLQRAISRLESQKVKYSSIGTTAAGISSALSVIAGDYFGAMVDDRNYRDGRENKRHNYAIDEELRPLQLIEATVDSFERENKNRARRELETNKQRYKEEEEKRVKEYWEAHPEEKEKLQQKIKQLDSEKTQINEKIATLRKEIKDIQNGVNQIEVPSEKLKREIEQKIQKLQKDREALGVLKGKEKRLINEEIVSLISKTPNYRIISNEKKEAMDRMQPRIDEIEQRIDELKKQFNDKEKERKAIASKLSIEK